MVLEEMHETMVLIGISLSRMEKMQKSFAQIYHFVDPDVCIDIHVSNGADYQYTLTHPFTQQNKVGAVLGAYLHDPLMPQLQDSL